MSGSKRYIFLILILLLAAFFRFYQITEVPPGLYPDEAINGNDAVEALSTRNFKLFYPDNNGREGLFINLVAFSIKIFGPHPWAVRLPSAIFGLLTILGLYLFTKELFKNLNSPKSQITNLKSQISTSNQNFNDQNRFEKSEIIALLSSFFLAVSFWHINFSRIGFRAILVPFFLVWGFYFLLKATRIIPACGRQANFHPNDPNNKNGSWLLVIGYCLLAGVFLGLGFYTYIAYRQ